MKPLRTLCFAFIGCLLLFSRHCAGVSQDNEAGTSASPKIRPGSEPLPPLLAERYIRLLNGQRIAALPSRTQQRPDQHFYAETPFYQGAPLFTTKTDPGVVEQALRDYGTAGVVDIRRHDARLIGYEAGHLNQRLFPDTSTVVRLFDLDPNIHILQKKLLGFPILTPQEEDIRHLPFANGRPILIPGSDTLGHMLRASYVDQKKFYLVRPGKPPILVKPRNPSLYSTVVRRERDEVERVLAGYQAARQKYGEGLAAVIWGRAITPNPRLQNRRLQRTSLLDYPRFTADASRENMVNALQIRGRFRIYTDGTRGRMAYKVKLKNPGAGQESPFEVSVEPLSTMERAEESLYASMGRIHLPA